MIRVALVGIHLIPRDLDRHFYTVPLMDAVGMSSAWCMFRLFCYFEHSS